MNLDDMVFCGFIRFGLYISFFALKFMNFFFMNISTWYFIISL
jgi:hypothetical protein